MHKEVVTKRKVIAIIMSVLLVTMALYIYEGIKLLNINSEMLNNLLNYGLAITVIILLGFEYKSCRISYKYSLIADKFIINQIESEYEKNLESVKIANIIYIGTKNNMPKNYGKFKSSKSYICDGIGSKPYICIYRRDDEVYKIVFQSSEYLVQRINKIKANKSIVQ